MTGPRLEIDLGKIHHNARTLTDRLAARGIAVTGVTKATLGSPEIARELRRAGVRTLGDARIENIETMRAAGVAGPMTLIRSPMLSQVDRVVRHADVSFNTEIEVIRGLAAAAAAAGRTHGIVLMVELGDLREGIMPRDLAGVVRETLRLPAIELEGIGANLGCQHGVAPGAANMGELSALAESIEATFGLTAGLVSGGNSANLDWAFGCAARGRINDLRLGESILLGREPLHRRPIHGLHTDAFALVGEVIESKLKPSQPWGDIAQTAFGNVPPAAEPGDRTRVLVALGHQDTDPFGLRPGPGLEVLGASSDHIVLAPGRHRPAVGSEMSFQLGYGALLRSMTSPFVARVFRPTVGVSAAPTPRLDDVAER